MRIWVAGIMLFAGLAGIPGRAFGQASEIPSAAPATVAGESSEQRGRRLLDEMVKALGGEAWLQRRTVYREGRMALFFHGQPNGVETRFDEWTRLSDWSVPASSEVTRIVYYTPRFAIIGPETQKRDIAHLWTADQGYELTYKGQTMLPKEQVTDYMRRRAHSIEEVMRTWVKAPGVMILAEGTTSEDRRLVDKVSILSANNDAVTLSLDQATHLPVQRSFQWRNDRFKDFDIDEETYSDYHVFQGVETPMNVTRYRDGDMAEQTYYSKVKFGDPMRPDIFDPKTLTVKR
jgi:hypothetical protein